MYSFLKVKLRRLRWKTYKVEGKLLWYFNSTLHQSSHGFTTCIHNFATRTIALAHKIPPATQASAYISKTAWWNFFFLCRILISRMRCNFWQSLKILYMGFRATLNLRKFKVALNPMYRVFLNFAKICISSCLSKFYNKKKFQHTVFEIWALKAKIMGVFSRPWCCYQGNLLSHENNTNVFISDWAVFWYHDWTC